MTGHEMKDIRVGASLSIRQMANLLGLTNKGPDRVREMESGNRPITGPIELVMIAIQCDCSPIEFAEED